MPSNHKNQTRIVNHHVVSIAMDANKTGATINHRRTGLEKKPNDKDLEFDNRPTLEILFGLAFRASPLYKNSVGLRGVLSLHYIFYPSSTSILHILLRLTLQKNMSANKRFHLISDLKPFKDVWRVQVKLIHSWVQNPPYAVETLEIVLADQTDAKVQCSCMRTLIKRVQQIVRDEVVGGSSKFEDLIIWMACLLVTLMTTDKNKRSMSVPGKRVITRLILGEIESKRKRFENRGIEGFRAHESGKGLSIKGEYFPREKNDEHKEANQDGQEVATKSKLKQGNNLIP
ncbi:hypothetical protein YC2023_083225 [Brassica napus]